ncbi:sybindin family protein [Besnoitia besnoiti]|uniref:Trafficking protein particle complex subunit n=1 Tax=Besnoitia besnoiti TaxID=94643 RepID=A0A2A9MPW3_BESBE|nr:sybindin family protein [Besnoitia besnoiti]PFH38791.1 sybindin family protein [Besnoitia besnoiti]
MYSLFINNKHGSLVYHRNFTPAVQLSANDAIRLASTFHGLSAIAAQVSPASSEKGSFFNALQPKGINRVEAENFRLQCLETLTGLKFVLVTELSLSPTAVEASLRRVYEAYSDYVLKNPFHDADMPIRCQLFDKEIDKIFADYITI